MSYVRLTMSYVRLTMSYVRLTMSYVRLTMSYVRHSFFNFYFCRGPNTASYSPAHPPRRHAWDRVNIANASYRVLEFSSQRHVISNRKFRKISGACSGFVLTRLRRKDNQLNGVVYGKTEYIFGFNVLNA